MSILISTQSYNNDEPTPYGLLIDMDQNTGKICRTLRIDTPVETTDTHGRIKPGLRGLYYYKSNIYVASWNTIFIVDKTTFKVQHEISHKWMSDIHGIFVNQDGIWVTSSLPDALILYSFEGIPIASLWLSETFIYKPNKEIDKEQDWRYKGKDFRGFREYHSNNVEVKGEKVYLTGRGENSQGRVLVFGKSDFIEKNKLTNDDLKLFAEGLYGPHDGIFDEDLFWVTETMNSSIAGINSHGKVVIRRKVFGKDETKIKYDGIMDIFSTLKKRLKGKGGKMITHWTRGLCINRDYIYVGQSTWAGALSSRARVVKLEKTSKKIINSFYIDIPNYPETRIYQVIHLEG